MSKRRADAVEKELSTAKKERVESSGDRLKRGLAALRKKAVALEAANETHIEEDEERHLCLVESQKDVKYWRACADRLTSLNERLESDGRELKSDREKLTSANEKLKSDYERLRQWIASCPIQELKASEKAAGRIGHLGTEPQSSGTEHVVGGPGEVNEEMQKEKTLPDEVNVFDARDSEPLNNFDLSRVDENRQHIIISRRQVDAIPDLSRFSKLEALELDNNLITTIRDGSMPKTLRTLNLSDNKIEEIRGLDALADLKYLYLDSNRLRQIKGLTGLVNLKHLVLRNNMIARIEGLDSLGVLGYLNLRDNNICKIENMAKLVHLEFLVISGNPIRKLENLDMLTRLTTLFVDATGIESFNGIEKLVNVKTISSNGNAITSLAYLEQLRCLKTLRIKNNKISDWPEVEKLAKLPSLKTVALEGNPIHTQDPASYHATARRALPQVDEIDSGTE